jgi:hypothetical protein
VECKQWSGSRYRLSALKTAIVQHRERAVFYDRVMHAGTVFAHLPVLSVRTIPVIITLIEEEIRVFDGVPLVPVHRLNAFISELDSWADGFSFTGYDDEDRSFPEDFPEDFPGKEPGYLAENPEAFLPGDL